MLKKFILSVVCLAMTAALYAGQVKVDHSSKEKLIESLIYATINKDQDAIWEIMPPALRYSFPKAQQEKIKKSLFDGYISAFTPSALANLEIMMAIPETRKLLIDEWVQLYSKALVRFDGQWYFDLVKFMKAELDNVSIPPCPDKVDHSSKEGLFRSFWLAVYYKKSDLVWECIAPACRNQFLSRNRNIGETEVKKLFLQSICKAIPPEMLTSVVKAMSNSIQELSLVVRQQSKFFVYVDGKWYFNPLVK